MCQTNEENILNYSNCKATATDTFSICAQECSIFTQSCIKKCYKKLKQSIYSCPCQRNCKSKRPFRYPFWKYIHTGGCPCNQFKCLSEQPTKKKEKGKFLLIEPRSEPSLYLFEIGKSSLIKQKRFEEMETFGHSENSYFLKS